MDKLNFHFMSWQFEFEFRSLICLWKIVGKLRCRKNEMSEKCDKKCFTFPTEIVSEIWDVGKMIYILLKEVSIHTHWEGRKMTWFGGFGCQKWTKSRFWPRNRIQHPKLRGKAPLICLWVFPWNIGVSWQHLARFFGW